MSRFHLGAAAALSLLAAAPAAAQPAQYVVQIYSFGFSPQPIHLAAGRPVTLTFANSSGSSHDFTAVAFFGRSRLIAGAAPGGRVELRPHETRTITLIPAPGTYEAHCSHFLHTQMGMSDTIVVQ
ncbi:MAG TPA: cupredoxin domain-containing protein [Sphingomicrobium sp.]|nr:cupredoxin domain-containing protein [Sphingomicrobium sp.]